VKDGPANIAVTLVVLLGGLAQLPVQEHPTREGLRAHLVLALDRCGLQTEALAALHDARKDLSDEYSVEPGPEFAQLELANSRHFRSARVAPIGGRTALRESSRQEASVLCAD